MCYAYPRPRCSGHAKEALAKAKAAHDAQPTLATAAALSEAERNFSITPDGIKQVRAAASRAIDAGEYKRSALLSKEADDREMLRELLSSSVKGVRDPAPENYIPHVVTAHPNPEFAYAYFEKDSSVEVRAALAKDADTPAELLSRLADDRNIRVRTHLRDNPAVDAEVREQLQKEYDLYEWLRPTFSWKRELDLTQGERQEILKKFAKDENDSAREYAARWTDSENVLRRLAEDPDVDVREAAAHNPLMPAGQLHQMAETNQRHEAVLRAIASHPNASAHLLQSLGSHPESRVRSYVAGNDRSPVPVLNRLTTDEDEYVRAKAAGNETTSGKALTALVWRESAGSHPHNQALANPSLPTSTLTHLAVNPSHMVAVRQNPSTPAQVTHIISEQFSAESLAAADDSTLMKLLEGTEKVDSSSMGGWSKGVFEEARADIRGEVVKRSRLVSHLLGVDDDDATDALIRKHPSQVKSMLGWK